MPANGLGMDADIVVFDPETISDVGTYQAPNQPAIGVQSLLINGTLVVADRQAGYRCRSRSAHTAAGEMTVKREDNNMMVRANSLWILLILLVALCLPHPVFAESDLESLKREIAEQREKLAEQTRKLEEMEKRLDEATGTPASPATPAAADEAKAANSASESAASDTVSAKLRCSRTRADRGGEPAGRALWPFLGCGIC